MTDDETAKPARNPCTPQLGYATTRQLIIELEVRMRISQEPETPAGWRLGRECQRALDDLPLSVLDYRTVDS